MHDLFLDKLEVLKGLHLFIDDQGPEVAPDSTARRHVGHQVQILPKPFDRPLIEPNLAIGVLIMVDVYSSENEVRWQLADIDVV
jgi:hypothetical protein